MNATFKLSTGPRTPAQVLAAADEIEAVMGRIANGKSKPADIPVEELAVLVQHARNTKGKKP